MVGEPEVTSEIIGGKIMVRIRQPVLRLPDREERDGWLEETKGQSNGKATAVKDMG